MPRKILKTVRKRKAKRRITSGKRKRNPKAKRKILKRGLKKPYV